MSINDLLERFAYGTYDNEHRQRYDTEVARLPREAASDHCRGYILEQAGRRLSRAMLASWRVRDLVQEINYAGLLLELDPEDRDPDDYAEERLRDACLALPGVVRSLNRDLHGCVRELRRVSSAPVPGLDCAWAV